MGKGHRHLKKLKSEKAKVKLKGSKHLPKGTNVTDTNFKIKQIVVPEQLKSRNAAEPLSKRKLNIRELLNRLQHYNTKVISDAITDLKEIISVYPTEIVIPNLNQLIHEASPLVLDKEKSVRQESMKLISLILTQVSVDQVAPFFDILSSYFRCAMTHLDTAIQEDSLLLLDVLLTHIPSLVAVHSNKILENFFDLISKLRSDSKPGRTLTLNLDSKLTTVKWRVKVLNRLFAILDAIIQNKNQNNNNNTTNVIEVNFNENQMYYPVYPNNLPPCIINLNDTIKNKNLVDEESNIVKNIDVLVPLLFETWLEVGPNAKEDTDLDATLTEEAASVLNCILNIFHLLHTFVQIYAKETGNNAIAKNFISKYKREFSKYIITYFSYSKIVSKKRKRNEKNNEVSNSSFCVVENLMICNLFCIFNKKINADKKQKEAAEKIVSCVQNIFSQYNPENIDENKYLPMVIKHLLLESSKSWNCKDELIYILNSTIDLYKSNKLSNTLRNDLFNILCEIVKLEDFNRLPQFQIWLSTLPNLLCRKSVSEKTINMIVLLAKQKYESFNIILKDNMKNILENLSEIKILDTEDKIGAKYKIISLIYFIASDQIFSYVKIIGDSKCDEKLKKYLQEIAILKYEQQNEFKIADRLRNLYCTESV